MSLAIAIKAPEGLVFAAESRVTYTRIVDQTDPATGQQIKVVLPITFDNATKLLSFDSHNYVGAVTYDVAEIGDRTANSFITEFLAEIGALKEDLSNRLKVKDFAKKLSDFYQKRWDEANNTQRAGQGNNMRFIVGGFDKNAPYAELYEIVIPDIPTPKLMSKDEFQVLWGGQRQIVDRVFNAIDGGFEQRLKTELDLTEDQKKKMLEIQTTFALPIVVRTLALQDCVKLALTMIRTTIDFQTLSLDQRGVGGHIDIATITRDNGLQFIQKKKINGEVLNHG